MALDAPNLDDRKFQDLVDEAKRAIPRYTPEWTDHNVHDPGVTMIELFAFMVENLLYRLNRVPDKNYIKFLDLIGVRLQPPKPAIVDVTFRLSAAQPGRVTIPAGTEVATVRTSTEDAVIFTTDRDLEINVPELRYFLVSPDNARFEDRTRLLLEGETRHQLFEDKPHEGNAFYLGFAEGLLGNTLALKLNCEVSGIGIDPRHPPLVWEYWSDEFRSWQALEQEVDGTKGLNQPGTVELYLPYDFNISEVDGRRACWVRCRAVRVKGYPFYSASPRLDKIEDYTIGGTVPASHNALVIGERIGRSNGAPNQVFRLIRTPVLPRRKNETLLVEPEGGELEEWVEVEDFANSGPDDPHFILDSVAGEIRFGPRLWEQDERRGAVEVQKGGIPPKEALLTFSRYRYGGGAIGNVGAQTLTVLKSSIPYVDSVTNRRPAGGGTDQEDIENAKQRGPLELRSITRAVTSEDYEYLAKKATDEVARARCLQPRASAQGAVVSEKGVILSSVVGVGGTIVPPGVVRLLLVPKLATDEMGRYTPAQLELPPRVRQTVRDFLDERRLLTTLLEIDVPRYRWVSVQAVIALKTKSESAAVTAAVERALNAYINPVTGGPEGDGWPFGRELYISEIYSRIQAVSGVDYVREVKLLYRDDYNGQPQDGGESIAPLADGLLVSAEHKITVRK
jgi:predicted phage baseplate assembly protein